jgi:hypothetical protein
MQELAFYYDFNNQGFFPLNENVSAIEEHQKITSLITHCHRPLVGLISKKMSVSSWDF